MRQMVVVLVLVLAGCSASDTAGEPSTTAVETTTTAVETTTTAGPTTTAPTCEPADPDDLRLITPSLQGAELTDPRTATDGDLTFIAAEVGDRSVVVWVYESPAMYTLSSNAGDVSYLREYPDPSRAFSSPAYVEVTTCR